VSDALFRLIGDGDRHSGGAIPLPDAFATILNELLDHGSADLRRLNHLVSDALMYKEERVMAAAWRSWPQFTRDIISVLEEMHLVKENNGKWELTHEFVPGYLFHLPNTEIGFTGRKKEERDRREHNEILYMALTPVFSVMKEKAGNADPLVLRLLEEAEKVLVRELKLDQPLDHKPSRYRVMHPRKPHEEGKKLRSGMTAFFRDVFWKEHAEPDTWYDLMDVSRKFEELHPDQPHITDSNLTGSMRKAGREMVDAGILESKSVMGRGSRKHVFRLKPQAHPGYAANATVVEVNAPVVTWEGLRGDRRFRDENGDPKA